MRILEEIALLERENFSQPLSLKQIEEMDRSESYRIYREEDERGVCGYLIIHDSFDVYEIIKIAVRSDARRKGIGEKLIERAFSQMDLPLFLEVRESNFAAQELYKKLGFEKVGERRGYYQDTGEKAILMLLDK